MSLYTRYHRTSDDRWLKLLIAADTSGSWLERLRRQLKAGWPDPEVPRMPDAGIQRNFVGASGQHTLQEAFAFYQLVKARCRSLGQPITANTRLVDFGCGWGRIIRFFLKDVPGDMVVGLDVDPEIIQVCRDTIHEGRYESVNPNPPTSLPAASVDLIYAYSVFSHLSEDVHLQWVREFARVLKPAGLVFATTQKRSFIEYCNGLTENQIAHPWLRALSRAFRPLDVALARYDAGEFVYEPTGGGGVREASFYGEAVVSERYVDKHWPPDLKKVSFEMDSLAQALIIAQKPR